MFFAAASTYGREPLFYTKCGFFLASPCLLLLFQTPAPVTDYPGRDCHQDGGQQLGHRESGSRKLQLICAQALYPDAPQAIAQKINPEHLPIELFVFPVPEHECQHSQVPHGFIEKSGMHLYIGNAVFHYLMLRKLRGYHRGIYQALFDTHGKKIIRIAAECLAVEKVPHRPMICPVISPRTPLSAMEKKTASSSL